MTLILFIFFNFILYVASRGLFTLLKLITKKEFLVDHLKISNLPIYLFFPIFSLFVIGNISILANFITPLKNLNLFWIAILFFLILINLKEPLQIENKSFLFISLFIIPLILSISSYGLKLHFDSIDYHINFQYWLRESKVVFGLSNLYVAYGWSTIYEYILSNFWLEDNFIGLHYVNLVFFVFFYNLISYNIIYSSNKFLKYLSINVAIYSFLDNFGINGGGNGFLTIQMVGKPDLAVGILFFVSFILFLNDFIKNKFTYNNLLVISTLALFSFQIKIVSAYLIIPLVIYFYNVNKKNISKYQVRLTGSLVFLLFIFILKNIIISGCLFFPLDQTCINNLIWTDQLRVGRFAESVVSGNNGFTFNSNTSDWFFKWINNSYNIQVYSNMLISFTLILIFISLIFKKNNNLNKKNEIYSLIFIFLIVLSFFVTGPTIRYGFGTFLIVLSSFTISKNTAKNDKTIQIITKLMVMLLFISISLTPRIYSYKGFIESPFELTQIEDSTEEYLNSDSLKGLQIIEVEDSICFIAPTCVKNANYEDIKYSNKSGYKIYSLNKSSFP